MALQKGFLLMEILGAILVMASFSLVVGIYWSKISSQHHSASQKMQALFLAGQHLETLKNKNSIPIDCPQGYSITVQKNALAMTKQGNKDDIIFPDAYLIDVIAQWDENNHKQQVVLHSIMGD